MKKSQDKQADHPGDTGYLAIGQVLRPQGLQGQVKLRPDTDDPARFLDFELLYQKTADEVYLPIPIRDVSLRKGFVYLWFGDDASVEEAEARRGLVVYIDRAHAAPLGEHENYIADLIGCLLTDTQGHEIGRLKDVLQPGASDVYVVDTQEGVLLIPALRHVILKVDTHKKLIMVDETRLSEVAVLAD